MPIRKLILLPALLLSAPSFAQSRSTTLQFTGYDAATSSVSDCQAGPANPRSDDNGFSLDINWTNCFAEGITVKGTARVDFTPSVLPTTISGTWNQDFRFASPVKVTISTQFTTSSPATDLPTIYLAATVPGIKPDGAGGHAYSTCDPPAITATSAKLTCTVTEVDGYNSTAGPPIYLGFALNVPVTLKGGYAWSGGMGAYGKFAECTGDTCRSSKVQIGDSFPAAGALIWPSPVMPPTFVATVDYTALSDGDLGIVLLDGNNRLLNVGDKSWKVPAGSGTALLAMSPLADTILRITRDVYLQAVLTPKDNSQPQVKSDRVHYPVFFTLPSVNLQPGCSDRRAFTFGPVDFGAHAVPPSCDLALKATVQNIGSNIQFTIDKQLLFQSAVKGSDLLPAVAMGPVDGEAYFGLDSWKTDARRGDQYTLRAMLLNEDTQQLLIADPFSLFFNHLHILTCVPDPKEILNVAATDAACSIAYSLWDPPLTLMRLAGETTLDRSTAAKIDDLPAQTETARRDDGFRIGQAGAALASLRVAYLLAESDDPNAKVWVADSVDYSRLAQSLDDAIAVTGRDKVSSFLAGQLKFVDGLGLPGKLGNVIKVADEVCNGSDKGISIKKFGADLFLTASGQKTDCVAKILAAYNALAAKPSFVARAAAPAAASMLGIASSWSFDSPVAKGAGFSAGLTLSYTPSQLPARPDFDESTIRMVSWDPAAGVAEVLDTTVDTANHTATAHLDHLAPFYSLAIIGTLANAYASTPVIPAGAGLNTAVAVDNLGTAAANVELTVPGQDDITQPLAPSAQLSGKISGLMSKAAPSFNGWLQLASDKAGVVGTTILGGSGMIEALPIETAANDTWVLTRVEHTSLYRTAIHVANPSVASTIAYFDLRGSDGTSVATYSETIAAGDKLGRSLTDVFSDLTAPFTGYMVITAGQNITAAALLMSPNALAAVPGKMSTGSTSPGKLYAPLPAGAQYALTLNLVNLDDRAATVKVHAYAADGTEPAAAVTKTLDPKTAWTQPLAAASVMVETSSLAVMGDVLLADSTNFDRTRAAIPLTASPRTSLVIPYVTADAPAVTTLVVSNAGAAAATAKASLYKPDGTLAGSVTLKPALNGTVSGALGTLLPAATGYIAISSDQPVTAIALIDPKQRDIAIVASQSTAAAGAPGGSTAAPAIAVTPSSLAFGSVAAGQSKDLTLTVTNNGNADLTVSALTATPSVYRVTAPVTPFTVAAGKSAVVTVRFTPTAAGTQSGSLTIASNDPAKATVVVSLAGSSGTQAAIKVTPSSLDFGAVTVAQSKDLMLAIQNGGTATLNVRAAAVDNARFAWISPPAPFTLAPGAQIAATVRFSPGAAGAQTGALTISSDDPARPSATVALTGSGAAAAGGTANLTVSPAALDFGTRLTGVANDLSLTLTATEAGALVIQSIAVDNPRFTIVSAPKLPYTMPLAPSNVTLRFTAGASANETATLTIVSNAANKPTLTVPLTAVSVSPGAMELKVDGGVYDKVVGFRDGASPAAFVNRLTPPAYPATLKSVRIFFNDGDTGLATGTFGSVVSGATTNGADIDNIRLTSATAIVTSTGRYLDFPVTPITITQGDFVAGFLWENPKGVYPLAADGKTASQGRSYSSSDGLTYVLLPANLAIRANVVLGP